MYTVYFCLEGYHLFVFFRYMLRITSVLLSLVIRRAYEWSSTYLLFTLPTFACLSGLCVFLFVTTLASVTGLWFCVVTIVALNWTPRSAGVLSVFSLCTRISACREYQVSIFICFYFTGVLVASILARFTDLRSLGETQGSVPRELRPDF